MDVQVGDIVNVIVKGEVVGVMKTAAGVKLEIVQENKDEPTTHCFVPLSAIEPRRLEELNEDKKGMA